MVANLIPETVAADSLLTLAVGITVLAALGYLIAARLRPLAWQRAIWQVVLLATAGLTAAELAGVSSCLSHLVAAHRGESIEGGVATASAVLTGDRPTPASTPIAAARAGGTSLARTDIASAERYLPLEAPAPSRGTGRARTTTDPTPSQTTVGSLRPTDRAGGRAITTAGGSPSDAVVIADARAAPTTSEDRAGAFAAGAAPLSPTPEQPSTASGDQRGLAACWLAVIWVLGFTALALLRAGVGSLLLLRFSRRLRPVHDDALAWSVYVISRRLGLRRPVRLCEAASLTSPMAWGIVRPVIALPPGFAEDFRADEQQAMLAHELAHLRGADPLWQRLADWLAVILWWHPAIWWARRQWRAASEATADEASLVVDGGPELLAECLVQMGGRMSGARPLGWVGMHGVGMRGVGMRGGFRSHLGRRVERLLSLGQERWRPPGRLFWFKSLIPIAAVGVAIVGTSWARSETSYQGEADMQMVKHYWRQSMLGVAIVTTLNAADRALASAPSADQTAAVATDPEPAADEPAQAPDRAPGTEAKREDDRPKEEDRPPPGRRDGDRPKADDHPREGASGDGPQPPRDSQRQPPRPGDPFQPVGGGDRGFAGDGDLERQLRHLKAAADNLEAAGLHAEAKGIRRQIAERAAKRGGDRANPQPGVPGRPDGDRPRGGDPRPGGGDPRPGGGDDRLGPDLMRVIQHLQDEVTQLRREVAEMRRMMPNPRGGRPEDGRRNDGRPGEVRPEEGRRDGSRRDEGGGGRNPEPGAENPPKRDFRPEGAGAGDDRPPPKREREGGEQAPPPKER